MRVSGCFEGQGTLQRFMGHQTDAHGLCQSSLYHTLTWESTQLENQVEVSFLSRREILPFPFGVRSPSTLTGKH